MLVIRKNDLQQIYTHCDREFPNEACGMLAGKQGRVETIYPMTNARPSPSYYEMEPAEQFRVLREIRDMGLDVIGIYHSHTGSPAYPSGTDVKMAYFPETLYPNFPEAVYLIVSLMDRKQPEARGFTIAGGTVTEVPVTVN
jgi:proteasome lid subunit RPN8/RPN11